MTKKSIFTIPDDIKTPNSTENGNNSTLEALQTLENTRDKVAVFLESDGRDARTNDSNLF